MPALYPLLLRPDFVERPWGARDLSPVYPEHHCDKAVGEVWLTGDNNRIANGPLAGRTLGELCREFGRSLVGELARETERFPLLIKFLFPREKLSVQVHPDDDAARRLGLPCGKTECWYVLAAEPGAQVALGLKRGVTREHLAKGIEEIRAEELLNWVDIYPGEMIYVDAGTVHTIGPGSILVETQQNSDTTYRLYDYGRPREIHVEQGLAAMKERTRATKVEMDEGASTLVESPCFLVEKFLLRQARCFAAGHSPQIFVALDGGGVAEAAGGVPVNFRRGDAVAIPACVAQVAIRPQQELNLLRMTLPVESVPEPETAPGTDH
jgi:mannose-6-phosphate isomerase